MIDSIMQAYGDAAYSATISECLGFFPVGVVLGLIAWAFGYVVVIFLRIVRSAV